MGKEEAPALSHGPSVGRWRGCVCVEGLTYRGGAVCVCGGGGVVRGPSQWLCGSVEWTRLWQAKVDGCCEAGHVVLACTDLDGS